MTEIRDDEFLSEEDLDLRNLTWDELIAYWNLWLEQAQDRRRRGEAGAAAAPFSRSLRHPTSRQSAVSSTSRTLAASSRPLKGFFSRCAASLATWLPSVKPAG
jgi:hypothetical protein